MLKHLSHLTFVLFVILVVTACSGGGGSGNKNKGGGGNNSGGGTVANKEFITFESGQVRPLAMSSDNTLLFAVNTPNSTLEIFSVNSGDPQHTATVPVGMEPVAVAVANDGLVWVVNHLSDSISIVDVNASPPRVIKTLLVGDEPRDIVFAGTNDRFAFITTAHRGQNGPLDSPVDPQLTESVGRADVWVFDTTNTGDTIGGDPVNVIQFFGDTPRALAVSPDKQRVYVAVFLSGNKTTTIGQNQLAKHGPNLNVEGFEAPDTGLVVKNVGGQWLDGYGNVNDANGVPWSEKVRLNLPDYDVFEIDASQNPPVDSGVTPFSGVGTVLYNMITNPDNDAIYVTNTEALNHVRFEGPGIIDTTVRGHFAESRITVISNNTVTPVHLNKHINYGVPDGTELERQLSLANPIGMAITGDGTTLYVAGFGSQKIGVYNTAELEANTFEHAANNQVALSAGGPSGVVLDEVNSRLYVLTRFDNGISVIDTSSNTETSHLTLFNPEPAHVVEGRKFLYDATLTSSHGDSSCALCHVFGDFDGLAWDLGNPDEVVASNPNPFATFPRDVVPLPIDVPVLSPDGVRDFHPMKGPMTTQSLRGLAGNGPMHWRGDRTGVNRLAGDSLEFGAFMDFNVAFPGLVGRAEELSNEEMRAYTRFALEITYPPSPIRALDNSLTPGQAEGRRIYLTDLTTGGESLRCNTCHTVDAANGHFGTSGKSSFEGDEISQDFKVPHLRNMYQKVGKFGASGEFFRPDLNEDLTPADQIKGFGFMHDGGMDTLGHFLNGSVFDFDPNDNTRRDQVIDFVFAMDSEMAPIVGQQITLTSQNINTPSVIARLDLLIERAQVTSPREECDLIVKGVINGEPRGALLQADGNFKTDKQNEVLSAEVLQSLVNENDNVLTFTCVPPGSGSWMGIDRDSDGVLDGDE